MGLSLEYLLDTIAISRAGDDIVDVLLTAAIVDANLAPIAQDVSLDLSFATTAPPDELRRPVSVNALAQSIGLPFETVRRRVRRLTRRGACVMKPAGLIVPQAVLSTPAHEAMIAARYRRLELFYADLRAAGSFALLGAPGTAQDELPTSGGPPLRLANRLLAQYLMRFVDGVMRRIGDPVTGLVLLEMARANTEHLVRPDLKAATPVLDNQPRPVRIARLAERLGIPCETVRRRIARLAREGLCERSAQGYSVTGMGIARPDVPGLMAENAVSLRRLFARLGRLGVLAWWDRELVAAAPKGAPSCRGMPAPQFTRAAQSG